MGIKLALCQSAERQHGIRVVDPAGSVADSVAAQGRDIRIKGSRNLAHLALPQSQES